MLRRLRRVTHRTPTYLLAMIGRHGEAGLVALRVESMGGRLNAARRGLRTRLMRRAEVA